jgi:predicted Zn-dependent protease
MTGVERPVEQFRVLNGLAPNEQPRPGSLVKIIVSR